MIKNIVNKINSKTSSLCLIDEPLKKHTFARAAGSEYDTPSTERLDLLYRGLFVANYFHARIGCDVDHPREIGFFRFNIWK